MNAADRERSDEKPENLGAQTIALAREVDEIITRMEREGEEHRKAMALLDAEREAAR